MGLFNNLIKIPYYMDMTLTEILTKARAPYAINVLREFVIENNDKEVYYTMVGERMRLITEFREDYKGDLSADESFRTVLAVKFNVLTDEEQLFEHTVTEAAFDSF